MDFDQELDRAASAFPDITDDFDPASFSSGPTAVNAPPSADFFGFDEPAPPTEVRVTGDDEIEKFENQFPELDGADTFSAPPPSAQPTLRPSFAAQPSAPSLAARSPAPPIFPSALDDEEEPEVIAQWKEKQAEDIRKREAAAAEKRAETIRKAEENIDTFYNNYNQQKEKTIKQNKENEAEYLSQLSEALSSGTTWGRICTLIDLENSQSKTLARAGSGTTDLTRFREVLLRLRREGDRAPGAAGY